MIYKRWHTFWLTLLSLSLLASAAFARDNQLLPDMEVLYTGADVDLDPAAALSADGWQAIGNESPNFGYITDTVWLRIPVPDNPSINLLEIAYAHLDSIRFYLVRDGEVVQQEVTGDHFPFTQRPILHRHFLFPFTRDDDGHYDILLAVQTSGAAQLPLALWHDKTFFEGAFVEDMVHAVYYGVLITAIFFNLFIFFTLRENVYLLYVLSTFGYLMLIGTLNGIAFQLIWPGAPTIQNAAMAMSIPFAMVFTLWFSRSFLRLKDQSRILERVVTFAILLNIAAAIATLFVDYGVAIRMVVALSIPCCLLLTLLGPQQWLRGNPQAAYYTLAWGALTLGSAITAANKYGWLPNNFLTLYSMQIGSATQAVLLAMALASRVYQERQDKVLARDAELRALEARRSAELKLMDQALHNPLTGLPNRSSYEMTLNDLTMRHPDTRFGVAVIHLNNLQAITKTLGHRNSDRLLELAARHFNSVIQRLPGAWPIEQTDNRRFFLASLDSATFAFVVNAGELEASPRAIVNGLEQLRAPIDYLGMEVPMDPRIGVAVFPAHGTDANTLIRRAIIAEGSDRARDRGIAYYKPSNDSYSASRLTLVSELRNALEHKQLALFLQPKQCLRTERIVGLEALIRWPDREHPIRPDEIIALAEQTGLIKPLTRWVLEEALRIRTRLMDNGWELDLSVNISPNNLREPDFSMFVQRLMTSYRRHRGAITFEVTETSMMMDPANSLDALNALDSAGIRVSIDDFGSGYSSLSYIKQLPAQEIKIDRSLVTDLATEANDRVIVQTTIDMCHNLGYKVVAEGVEDTATSELLRDMGCDMIQGYLLTPPIPLPKLLDWLNQHASQSNLKLG